MSTTWATLFSIGVALGVPAAALVVLLRRRERLWVPYLLGGLTFTVFQMLIRIPLLQLVLPRMHWFTVLPYTSPVLYALLLSLSAALFEEGGRYLVMRWLMRRRMRWVDGLAFGLGHGGIEAVLLVGINALAALILYGGTPGATVGHLLAAGVERLSAMALHVGWSLMVLRSVRMHKPGLLALTIALHTAVNMLAVLLQGVLPLAAIEALLAVVALGTLAYGIHLQKTWEEPNQL